MPSASRHPDGSDPAAAIRTARSRIAYSDIPIPRDRGGRLRRPPGPHSIRVLRNLLTPVRAPWFMEQVAREHPTVAQFTLLGLHRYLVSRPELVVDVFVNHAHDTVKGPAFDVAKAFVGNGLLTAEGPAHLSHRRLVQPAFSRASIVEYSRTMVEFARVQDETWSQGERVDMSLQMSELTLKIVGRTLFSVDVSGDAAEVGQAMRDMLHVLGRYAVLGTTLWRYPTPARRRSIDVMSTMDRVVQRIIDDHRGSETHDMLSLLMAAQEEGAGFTDAQVRDEVITLVIAGHETTAMLLTWTWMLLAQHPDAAAWMHEELDSLLAGRAPSMGDLESLPRTRAIVSESLRLYPPVWLVGRRLLTDIELDGWTVPAGANVMSCPFAMQRDPAWWEDPNAFAPARWIDAAGAYSEHAPEVPRGVWAPFGWGNRKCIGEHFAWTEAVLILATLAQRWAPELAPGAPVRPEGSLTLRPQGGMPMVLMRR